MLGYRGFFFWRKPRPLLKDKRRKTLALVAPLFFPVAGKVDDAKFGRVVDMVLVDVVDQTID